MTRARRAVALTFALNGLCFATWVSRIPEARASFDLSNGALGLLLLAVALGSTVALPLTGATIARFGTRPVVRFGAVAASVGLSVCAFALGESLPVTAAGLACFGLGIGVWDVAMNTEGTVVERGSGRSMMPRFHALFSLGTVAGALTGAGLVSLGVPAPVHLGAVAALALVGVLAAARDFLDDHGLETEGAPAAWRAWLEPRTVLIGVMVLALSLAEGTANDWLAVALVDGHEVSHAAGVAGFALFVAAMTLARWFGVGVLDRYGRATVLWSTMGIAALGVLLLVLADHPALVALGILLWGTGASLGFPVGMSAAGDDPRHAPARLSVVSTIGYTAFLAGPPLLGFLADHVGTLDSLLVVVVALVPAALAVPAARKQPARSQPAPA